MVAVIHGRAGHSLEQDDGALGSKSRRGAYFERVVAAALEQWLARRPDVVHVFHDLTGFQNVVGAGEKSLSLGASNIDHLLLTGNSWVMIDAKGCGTGSLRTDRSGRGYLLTPRGDMRPQPWMDNLHSYARAGIPSRLTEGKIGAPVWVLTDETDYSHPSFTRARCFEDSGTVLSVSELGQGELDELEHLLFPVREADPDDVARLRRHLSTGEQPPKTVGNIGVQ